MQFQKEISSIVLIADRVEDPAREMNIYDRDLDKPHPHYVEHLFQTLQEIHPNVILYNSPQELIVNNMKHRDDLVFPFWFGEKSRNRHALIPAICEASNIKYVGADAYTKAVCNDKHVSKLLCKELNLATPNFAIWNSPLDDHLAGYLQFPCVVKPAFEGTSLGIGPNNLVSNLSDAILIARALKEEFQQTILIEEFIPGKEVSICLIGQGRDVHNWAAAERYLEDDVNYFEHRLYTYIEKKSDTLPLALRSVTAQIPDDTLQRCFDLFAYLDKVEFMRIDGRLKGTDFSVIELTPDTHLGADSEFAGTFIAEGGFNYHSVIRLLIENCIKGYQSRNANK
ncbi:hypothetical protein [Hufsiella ginkgonis]|uniref:ATP-grasp domain-containing protein n=1 Tax=Hufsiella ginkgonis TaxID=2695274 RepID=A0A7K1XSM1_9SPHI|nr:hypothetical protein [Hufsiella ginkgonis]MXV14001.1 hypothetical protein [Hufsiella ginkgonis]